MVYTAYFDEGGTHNKNNGYVVIAGHVGDEAAWTKFIPAWKEGLGQRKRLHMRDLRWTKSRTQQLLSRLGPIPVQSGLQRVIAGVNVSEYADLLGDTTTLIQKLSSGYMMALQQLLPIVLKKIPRDETLEISLEMQIEYKNIAMAAIEWVAQLPRKELLTGNGGRKLARWSFVDKRNYMLCDQADYTAYALLQKCLDPDSKKAKWCSSVLESGTEIGWISGREEMRWLISN